MQSLTIQMISLQVNAQSASALKSVSVLRDKPLAVVDGRIGCRGGRMWLSARDCHR